ncbi:CBS domain-containing protein CBSX3, mitochondrial-like [Coffea eugenioides]|uniref:CBS domain-containing protein CBSX3, mitochondrial-like n=1 Tax=Coffea arabica TaxID=13443 RepID=A0ABM4W1Z4_COFAR|nr:CBS domain-containing protein CBSX3, mitochondrial-like [Coffea eugenioides]
MLGFLQAIRSYQEKLLGHSLLRSTTAMKNNLLRLGSISSYLTVEEGTRPAEESSPLQHKGLENVTVAEVLMTKGGEKAGSWLSCRADDTVYDAVKQMAQNNIGSLVVLKPGQQQLIAGILTERDYLRKVVVQDRSSKYTRVGEIMTDQDNLVTVTSDTNILHAMQLMTENHIRHVPVIDGKIAGMISIVDVVRAVVEQQSGDMKRLNEFIRGEYY